MFNQEQLREIKEVVTEFFEKTSFGAGIEFPPAEEATVKIRISTEEPQILIGEGGQTLLEIQHLLKAILRRKMKENLYVDLDINDYKKQKTDYLKDMARSLADEVALTKKEKILPVMPAYERRIIHLELSQRTDVATESLGQEPERKIVIKPRS